MRAPVHLSMIFEVNSVPALDACPSPERIGKICKAGSDLAVELARDMPVERDTMRLDFPVGTINGLMIVAEPAADSTQPDPANAAEYLCGYDAVRAFVSSGGTIGVMMNASAFLTLSTCEAP